MSLEIIQAKSCIVGGAVRDMSMGAGPSDIDWVVVGSSEEEMLAGGFTKVGKSFHVYIHPITKDEYALARKESKVGDGKDFIFDVENVSLLEDLYRRDLTINAMALIYNGYNFEQYDPYGGQRDIDDKILRHVSEKFTEDPLRILRVARFAAKFPDFSVHPDTMKLMRKMVRVGTLEHLSIDRIVSELKKGLMEKKPSKFLKVLQKSHALAILLPTVDELYGVEQDSLHHPEIDVFIHTTTVLDMAAELGADIDVRLACLFHDIGKGRTPQKVLPKHHGHDDEGFKLLESKDEWLPLFWDRCGGNSVYELVCLVTKHHGLIHRPKGVKAKGLMRLLRKCDAIRRKDRFEKILLACECDARGRGGKHDLVYWQRNFWNDVLKAATSIDIKAIIAMCNERGLTGEKIKSVIYGARVSNINKFLKDCSYDIN